MNTGNKKIRKYETIRKNKNNNHRNHRIGPKVIWVFKTEKRILGMRRKTRIKITGIRTADNLNHKLS